MAFGFMTAHLKAKIINENKQIMSNKFFLFPFCR